MQKNLKGQRIVISENVTINRYKIYQAVILKFDRKTVWRSDDSIIVRTNSNKVVISSLKDLDKY